MNTPAHLIIGAAAFARPAERKVTLAALAGAVAPDVSLYVLVGVSILLLGVSVRVVFGEYYYSEAWQQVFAVDNSFILWGLGLLLALWSGRRWAVAFAGAGLLQLAFDFPLHHDDTRRHFWPVSDWVFESPFSYWDRSHYGSIIGPLEILLCVFLLWVLWRRFAGWKTRSVILGAAAMQVSPAIFFGFMFG
ncbi:MAG: cobalamin biosynthesis protein CobQ [Alphaproteobacteria bacterium]|nr:cobalamin biosynthesis protein CobQ [Alphaproteobacteria bacterium]